MGGSSSELQCLVADAMGCGSSRPTKDELAEQLQTLYQIKETLGHGATATVYRCSHRKTHEEVAVKALGHDAESGARLKLVVDMVASLQHRNIVSFRDTLIDSNSTFLVMDSYSGGDLVDSVNLFFTKNARMESHRAAYLGKQMASAIQYIHSVSIVHRDVKPDNFLLDRNDIMDANCRIVLCDFDSAVYMKPDERRQEPAGTRRYWPLECFKCNYGMKVDVWAMGVTLYGVLFGRTLFTSEKQIKYMEPVIEDHVDAACKHYLSCLLQKGEKQRYTSDQAVAHRWVQDRIAESPWKILARMDVGSSTSASSSFCLETSDNHSESSRSSEIRT